MRMRRLLGAALLSVALLGGLISIPASAQTGGTDRTPEPSPTGNGGNATWTVVNTFFQSNFPRGVRMEIEVTSSGGKLKSATVAWRHQPQGSRKRANGVIDASGTKAVAEWIPSPSDGVPQWVEFDYWWILEDEAGNRYETEHLFDEYADTTRRWLRAESEDLIIIYEEGVPEEVTTDTFAAMEQQRETYHAYYPNRLPYKPRAIIYNGYEAWRDWAPGAGTAASATGVRTVGRTSDDWGATIQLFSQESGGSQYTAYVFVVHEVAHLYQFANGSKTARLPFWFFEGDATYFELIGRERNFQRAQALAQSGRLPSIQGEGPSRSGASALDAYDIGYAFWVWLNEAYGKDAHRTAWELIGKGVPYRDALQRITNMNFLDMEVAFRTWLGAPNPIPPTPMPTLKFTFPPTPTFAPTPAK